MVALDDAGALQRAHPPQAGWCRDAGALRQLHIGHAAAGLKVADNSSVYTIELRPGHWISSVGGGLCQNHPTNAINLPKAPLWLRTIALFAHNARVQR